MRINILKNSLLVLSLLGVMTSCKKEDITIEKNDSLSWEIDKKITEDDIRNRIGYDPRFSYAYFTTTDKEIPMLSLENVPLVGNTTTQVEVTLLNAALEDQQVTIAYDAAFYDKVKAQYPNFELGDASLIKIAETTKTIAKGTRSVKFDLVAENQTNLTKNLIFPYVLKIANEKVKLVDKADHFVAKFVKKSVTIGTNQVEFDRTAYLKDGKVTFPEANINIDLSSDNELPFNLSIGIVRDDASLGSGKTLAPQGVEGTLPKEEFEGTDQSLSISLDPTKMGTTLGKYDLPLKWVIYDSKGTMYDLPNNKILVNITLKEKSNELIENSRNSSGSHDENPSGTIIADKSGMSFWFRLQDETGRAEKMIDGQTDDTAYFKQRSGQFLYFQFPEKKRIKSIRFTIKESHGISSLQCFASNDLYSADGIKYQGRASFTESGKFYTVTFKESILTQYLVFGAFRSSRGNNAWFEIYEVDFYEE